MARITVCDRCGGKCSHTEAEYTIYKYKHPTKRDMIKTRIDLCDDCQQSFKEWINYVPGNAQLRYADSTVDMMVMEDGHLVLRS